MIRISLQRRPGEVIRALRQARGLTGADLARRVGTTKETIHKIETGRTRRSSVLPEIARELGVSVEEISPEIANGPSAETVDRALGRTMGFARGAGGIPLYSAGDAGEGNIFIRFEPIDFFRRPAPLMHVQGAYALLVDGSTMVPALEPSDVALVNPRLFPRKGMNILLLQDGEEQVRGTLKRYEGQSSRHWRASQWQPQRTIEFEKADWPRIHSVIGKYAWR